MCARSLLNVRADAGVQVLHRPIETAPVYQDFAIGRPARCRQILSWPYTTTGDIPFPITRHTPGSSCGNTNAASFSFVSWNARKPHSDNPVL